MRIRYENRRTLVTLTGPCGCGSRSAAARRIDCARYHKPYRPEAEGALALAPARVRPGRDRPGRGLAPSRASQRARDPRGAHGRGVAIAERSVTNLLDRYDELLATRLMERQPLRKLLAQQGRVILALDGLQPDVGHEVLWVIRDCLSGIIVLARSLLSGRAQDLAALLREVVEAVGVPVVGVISDGQTSIRQAVAQVLPGVPHQLCQFHFLREAAHPIFEADRHAKKELKKQVRGIRRIERAVEERDDAEAALVQGYCAAVRSAITDDGRAPLAASGLKLKQRLEKVADSLERVQEKGASRRRSRACTR